MPNIETETSFKNGTPLVWQVSQTKASKAQDAARQLKARQIATDINLLHGTLSSTAIAELHLSLQVNLWVMVSPFHCM